MSSAKGAGDTEEQRSSRSESRPRIGPLLGDLWVSGAILIYGIAFWLAISELPPDAANYPHAVILVLFAFVAWGLLADLFRWRSGAVDDADDELAPEPDAPQGLAGLWHNWYKTAAAFVLTAAFVYAIPRAGFYESTAVYLLLLFAALGIRRLIVLIPLTAGVTAGSYLLFEIGLNVLVPSGPLFG